MKSEKITIEYSSYSHKNELSEQWSKLLEKAKQGLAKSHAPYSHFNVGAALLLENGEILVSANFENASFPLSLCAERMVLATAASLFPRQPIVAVAVTALSSKHELSSPIPPCGGCRQAILEVEESQEKPICIILQGEKGEIFVFESIKKLLPLSFSSGFL